MGAVAVHGYAGFTCVVIVDCMLWGHLDRGFLCRKNLLIGNVLNDGDLDIACFSWIMCWEIFF